MARGSVLLSQEIQANGDQATITFTATPQMAPKSRLVVYAVRPSNQEILVDAVDFKVNGLFRNDVSLSVDRTSAEPGDPVKLIVKADTDSYVGLLAVDQSVLLLKSGNDITKEMVCWCLCDCQKRSFPGGAGHHGVRHHPWPIIQTMGGIPQKALHLVSMVGRWRQGRQQYL